jgi:uncharacterized membrane protein
MPTRRRLVRLIDAHAVEAVIARAEQRTSGEIRVSLSPWFWGSVRRTAERAFDRLGIRQTRDRNGILIFVVPARRRFVVLGDEGIHRRVDPGFWEAIGAILEQAFAREQYTEGLIAAIERLADRLASDFPVGANDVAELPDNVDFGEPLSPT